MPKPAGHIYVPAVTMCVTNIYVDRYPDGREIEYRHLSTCQYGSPGRPCSAHSTLENPVRRIQYNEPSSQYMFNHPVFPSTPPRSPRLSGRRYSGTSYRQPSRSRSRSDDGRPYRHEQRPSLKPPRQHRQERIIIVDAPPTPTTPPQLFAPTFSAPSSPDPRGRPVIVDERPRAPSPRRARPAPAWDTPSASHTSFDLRAGERTRRQRDIDRDEEARRARRIAEANEDIKRRAAVPLAPRATYVRPVIEQVQGLPERLGGLSLEERGEAERRRERERERAMKQKLEAEEEEAMKRRLRERQMPRRRFTVGPGHRRHRVLYDDGLYRWE